MLKNIGLDTMRKEPYRSLLITTFIYVVFFSIVLYNEFDVNLMNFDKSVAVELNYELSGGEESGTSQQALPEEPEPPAQQANEESILTEPNTTSFNAAPVKTGDTSTTRIDSLPGIIGSHTGEPGNDTSKVDSEGEGGSDMVYGAAFVAEMPSFFGGGTEKFREWLLNNIRSNEILMNGKANGTIMITFIIDSNGKVINISLQKGINEKFDKEIVKMIGDSPPWEPGKQQGHPVKVLFNLPIVFSN